MSRITIYLSIKDGELEYRDTESHYGRTIETFADPGDKIIWTLDDNSGIKDLSGINIIGSCKFFSRGPKKKGCDKWIARVGRKAKGDVEYQIFTDPMAVEKEAKEGNKSMKFKRSDSSRIRRRI